MSNLHLNADWVILEPVDAALRPVPPGNPSHSTLLTNLANRVQPIIRYDLGDSVTMLPAPPSCHRTNSGPKIRQTATRVSDESRYRSLAGRIIV